MINRFNCATPPTNKEQFKQIKTKKDRALVTDLHLIGLDHEETLQILWEKTIINTETDSTYSVLI